ncbi:MAG TPA: M4 family metallopeptidase [Polyangia bacterium]|nr:M4 family metallopeptidase [Polyangia bacterium]
MSRSFLCAALFTLCAGAVGCSGGSQPTNRAPKFTPYHVGPSRAQGDALGRLESDSGSPWTVGFDSRFHSPTLASGHTPPMTGWGRSPTEAALAFLRQYRDLFLIGDPDTELSAVAELTVGGHARVDFVQQLGALPVYAAGLRVHFDAQGSIRVVSGRYIPHLDRALADRAGIDPANAVQLATDDLLAALPSALSTDLRPAGMPEPVLFADGTQPRPAYHIRLRVANARVLAADYMIDAERGDVLGRHNDTRAAAGSGVGLRGDRRTFEVSDNVLRSDGVLDFALQDMGRSIDTQAPDGDSARLIRSPNPNAWDAAGVDAHYFMTVTYDHFASTLGRVSFDGLGQHIYSTVHVGSDLGDAAGSAWDPDEAQFLFSDRSSGAFPGVAALDVVAHEFTHAVVDYSARLEQAEQPGALSEAIADIFACFVEHSEQPDDANNVTIGEGVGPGGAPYRDLSHPQKTGQPDHVSGLGKPAPTPAVAPLGDDVHRNAGVPANAWYLMTLGGRNDSSGAVVDNPMGWEASEKVWYQALTQYLGERADFETAALATVQAAQDLFGESSSQARTASCAWAATGVLPNGCGAAQPPDCRSAPDAADPSAATPAVFCHPYCGTLSKDRPSTWYAVQGAAGQRIEITLTGLAADYDLHVVDDGGNPIGDSAKPGTADEAVGIALGQDATFYVQVTGATLFSAVPYVLRIGSDPICRLVQGIAGVNIDPRNTSAAPPLGELQRVGANRVRIEFKVPRSGCASFEDSVNADDLTASFRDFYDPIINQYTQAGIDVLLVLDYATACIPASAQGRALCLDTQFESYNTNAFQKRVREIVTHYQPNRHVYAYEIWNEEDTCDVPDGQGCGTGWAPGYCPSVRADQYARLLVDAAATVHDASKGRALALMGGLGAGQWSYVDSVKSAAGDAGWAQVDAIAVHPYVKWFCCTPPPGPDFTDLPRFLDDGTGKGKPVWVTEWGIPDDTRQLQLIHDYFAWFVAHPGYDGVQESYYFAWSDSQRLDAPHFGLFSLDGGQKDSWQVFHDMATKGP